MAKQQFLRKPHSWGVYKWSPLSKTPKKKKRPGDKTTKEFCNAVSGGNGVNNGEDWNVTFVYNQYTSGGDVIRSAYVACNYVI